MPRTSAFSYARSQPGPSVRDVSGQIAQTAAALNEAEKLWDKLGGAYTAYQDDLWAAVQMCPELSAYIRENAQKEVRKHADMLREKLTRMLAEAKSFSKESDHVG